jgi:hypothetical protein
MEETTLICEPLSLQGEPTSTPAIPAAREPLSRPGEPTSAPPGSPRKIRILMERAARREALFHPLDGIKRRLAVSEPAPQPAEQPVSPAQQ